MQNQQQLVGPTQWRDRAFANPLIAEIAGAVASELRAETYADMLPIESIAMRIAARLTHEQVSVPTPQPAISGTSQGLDRRRLQRVLEYIQANLKGDLTLERMAEVACLSRYHFARAFRQAVGKSPHRYVTVQRIERAKALLAESGQTLVEIALALNFSSQASFTRAFRQITGIAPGQFRRSQSHAPTL